MLLTTERTAPGFCMRIDLTTWNTSTIPSVLHLSITDMTAQKMALRLTVSLILNVQKT